MEKKITKIPRIQRIKKINKFSTMNSPVYLIKYIPKKIAKNNNNPEYILCLEKEIIINESEDQIKNYKEKLEKEIKLINSFPSNYFLKIYEYFQYPENVFHIITENYQNDLSDLIKSHITKKSFLSESTIITYFSQIFSGIKYLHDSNILHRNINPSNIILISNKSVKISISNFFLRSLYNEKERSITFINNNWREYMSPEMTMNIPYSFKNDIWALGVLLFHTMSLKLPFSFKKLNEIQFTKKVDSNLLYNRLPKQYSRDLKNLCVNLLKAFPAERPDINTIFTNYKIFGNKYDININKIGNKTLNNNEKIIRNINLNNNIFDNNKFNFKSICSQYVKFGRDKKIINTKNNNTNHININKTNEENFKISVYENIKDKINDPYNIINNRIITNSNINETDNYIDINNFKSNSSNKEENNLEEK